MANRLVLTVAESDGGSQLQVTFGLLDEDGTGHGYRLSGPTRSTPGGVFASADLLRCDRDEIRRCFDAADEAGLE